MTTRGQFVTVDPSTIPEVPVEVSQPLAGTGPSVRRPLIGVEGKFVDGFVTVSRLHLGRIGGTIESRGSKGRTGAL